MSIFATAKSLKSIIRMSIAGVVPPCRDITRLLSQSMDGVLPFGTRVKIRFHLLFCIYCSRYKKQLQFIRRVSRSMQDHVARISGAKLPADARERLKQALKNEPK